MAGQQTYEEIENLINDMDALSKEQIKDRLKLLLIDPCKVCNVRCEIISKRGYHLDPTLINNPTGLYCYEVCSNCNNIESWSL